MVRLLNHFIQQFFWEDTTTSGNTFKLFVDFFRTVSEDGTISTLFITRCRLKYQEESLYAESGELEEETCVNFALFRLGLLSSKTVPVAHSSPPSYQTWRRQTSISAPG